jgi:hypothetical protein
VLKVDWELMVTPELFRNISLSFEGSTEQPHFDKPSFRVNKKIFATLDLKKSIAVLKLTPMQQSVFCTFDKTVIYPVEGNWGKQGWTVVNFQKADRKLLINLVTCAYCNVAPEKLSVKYRKE